MNGEMKGPADSDLPEHAYLGGKIGAGQVDFWSLVRTWAKKSLFLAAQNHYFLTRDENEANVKAAILGFLNDDTERRVDIMMCAMEADHAVDTWGQVQDLGYRDHLEHSTKVFRRWLEEIEEDAAIRGRLCVRKNVFVPVSCTIVDENLADGFLVLVPNVYTPTPGLKPYLVISKQNNFDAFETYRQQYRQYFIPPRAVDVRTEVEVLPSGILDPVQGGIKKKYQVLSTLGGGAQGKVHLVSEKQTGKKFAVKRLPSTWTSAQKASVMSHLCC